MKNIQCDLSEHEKLVQKLTSEAALKKEKKKYDSYACGTVARTLGAGLIALLNALYGKKPSYAKFKAIEVIARIPYQSWEMVSYWLTTFFFTNTKKSMKLTRASDFGKIGQDNETMHVVVLSQICEQEKKGNVLLHTIVPVIVSHIYFIVSYVLFFINKKFSYELNYLFENHAYAQYNAFLKPSLKKKTVPQEYLQFYGKVCKGLALSQCWITQK